MSKGQKAPLSLRLSDDTEAWLRAHCAAIGQKVNPWLAELVERERARIESTEGDHADVTPTIHNG